MAKSFQQRLMMLFGGAVCAVASYGLLSKGFSNPSAGRERAAPIVDDFNTGGWRVYDYHGGLEGSTKNVYYPVTWEEKGGVNDSGYVWGDDSRWRIDTPESPHSILAFIIYRSWLKKGPVDLRNARLSVHFRGDKLDLKGSRVYFWALSNKLGTRWHMKAKPLAVPEGGWSERQVIVLEPDEKLWNRSWSRYPNTPASLDEVLRECESYGFSFLGFNGEVTGKFAMDELVIEPAAKP